MDAPPNIRPVDARPPVRLFDAPGLPVETPTESYWLRDPPFPELVDIRSLELPSEADLVIIGSGIAGAAIARSALREWRRREGPQNGRQVVVLEAREVCSGATGRNGGHIKASPHELFHRLRGDLGPKKAAALVRFQLRHLAVIRDLCAAEHIHVAECREVETVDLYVDSVLYQEAGQQVQEVRKWLPEVDVTTWTAVEAQRKFHVNDSVVGAISYKAGALWPYRFVTAIWRGLLDVYPGNLSMETRTPVSAIDATDSSEFPYKITTSRGTLRTKNIAHATNAFASQLIPGLKGKMTSLLAHMSAQRPGNRFPDYAGLRSWSIIYGPGFDYITQRPRVGSVPGDIMLGGGFGQSTNRGLDQLGVYDDGKIDALTSAHILGIMPAVFGPNWGIEVDARPKQTWTGIVSFTADSLPLVGRLDERLTGRGQKQEEANPATTGEVTGEWVAAGFVGEGMVWAWLSGVALGVMISGSEDDDVAVEPGRPAGPLSDWFPRELEPDYERVKKMDLGDLVRELVA